MASECGSTYACLPHGRDYIWVAHRPNVGKSTIANRLTQKFGSGAIVHDEPGVTRDRTYGYGWWGSHEFAVVDTGGIVFDDDSHQVFMPQIRQQVALAAFAEILCRVRLSRAFRPAATICIAIFLLAECVGVALFAQTQRVDRACLA